MSPQFPMISYMRKVLDEHTIPVDEGGLIEAIWLVKMISKVEETYRSHGTI